MDTFLVSFGLSRAVARQATTRAFARFDAATRTVFGAHAGAVRLIEIGDALIGVRTGSDARLVEYAEDARGACVTFGRTRDHCGDDGEDGSSAGTVLREVASSGVRAAREIEGCFSAVAIARSGGALQAFSDCVGQRTLRYARVGDGYIISPHDILLLATGLVPYRINERALQSLAVYGWPLGEESLAEGIETLRPYQSLKLSASGGCEIERLSFPERRAEARVDETIAAELIATAESACKTGDVVVELSAGADSRAALAAVLANKRAADVTCFSAGDPQSTDVKVAREIARRIGARFENPPTVSRDPATAVAEMSEWAIASNGVATVTNTLTSSETDYASSPKNSISGESGEIYSGYYYPPGLLRGRPPLDRRQALARIASRGRAYARGAVDRSGDALLRVANDLVPEGDGYDILDAFYVYERLNVWNAKQKRLYSASNRLSPFDSRNAFRIAATAGSPIGLVNNVHAYLVKNFLPEAFHIPVNNRIHLCLGEYGAAGKFAQRALFVGGKLAEKAARRFTTRRNTAGDLETSRASAFAQFHERGLMPFDWAGGVAALAFGEERATALLAEALAGGAGPTIVVGDLMGAHLFHDKALAVSKAV